jgi:shikimate dehydrogenase
MGIPYAEVIGDPIAHSKSPLIHKFWLEKLGIEGDYRATRVRANELARYFASRRADPAWRGCNLTMPLKEPACLLVDHRSSNADGAGAVNCITPGRAGLLGSNTDVEGLIAASGPLVGHQSACIIGAGGAARAAVYVLDRHSVRDIRVLVRRPERARQSLSALFPGLCFFGEAQAVQALAGAERIIQASAAGMVGEEPMSPAILHALEVAHPDATALEMVYAPVETPFLKRAASLGFHITDGLEMLIGQAQEAFRLFFGGVAPRKSDGELRQALTQ